MIQREKARRKLIDFTTYTYPSYSINWHHRNLADKLDKLARKEIKRLMVFMPPRHGKTELASRRFPAFIFGINPNARIIGTSYSASLANSISRDVQRIMESPRYSELFPDTKLGGIGSKYVRKADAFEIVGYDGYYLAAGVGGGITGYGADFAIVDDPIKNRKDAESKTYRDAVFDWFTSTLYTRLEKNACVLLVLTRWHEDDLAGRLLRLAEEDPNADQWEVISYPALFDASAKAIDPTDPRKHGEALWREKYDEKALLTIKATIGSYEWLALYEQRPSSPQGSIIKRDYIKYYKISPSRFDEVIQSWDLSFDGKEDSDFVVGQVWGRLGAFKFLLDQVRGQMTFSETISAVKSLSAKWPQAQIKLIENKANGPALRSVLDKEIGGFIPIEPNGSKAERLHAVSPQFEAGNVLIPDPSVANWVHDYVEELVSFPNVKNDDQVDATTQALIRLEQRRIGQAKIKAKTY